MMAASALCCVDGYGSGFNRKAEELRIQRVQGAFFKSPLNPKPF